MFDKNQVSNNQKNARLESNQIIFFLNHKQNVGNFYEPNDNKQNLYLLIVLILHF